MTYKDELKLIIKAEVDKAIRDLGAYNKVTGKAESTTVAFSKAANLVKKTLATAGLGVSLTILIAKLNTYAKSASEAEETASKFAVVFRDIADQAKITAKAYAASFDVAESTAKKLLGNVGDLLSGMGATQSQALALSEAVAILGTDLASFTNYSGGATGAVDALTKMMLGEREMVKSLGIVIRETDVQQRLAEKGQKDLTGTAKLLATAQVSLELATEQSKNSIGDYARTADGTANVNRRLQESFKKIHEQIGSTVNEVLTPLKASLADVLDTISAANENVTIDSLMLDIQMGKQTIDNLETTADKIDLLAVEYEQLTRKTLLSTEEQDQLKSVIQDIVSLVPSAATGFDQYGKALGVSAEKVREFANRQRELSKLELQIQKNNLEQTQLLNAQKRASLLLDKEEQKNLNEKWLDRQNPTLEGTVRTALQDFNDGMMAEDVIARYKDQIEGLGRISSVQIVNFLEDKIISFDKINAKVKETTAAFNTLDTELSGMQLVDLQIQQLHALIKALDGDPTKLIASLEAQIALIPQLHDQFTILQDALSSGMITTDDYAASLQKLLDTATSGSSGADTPAASILDDFQSQIGLIDTLSGKYADFSDLLQSLGVSYDEEAAKQELVADTFKKIMQSADIAESEIQAFIETYGTYLEKLAEPGAVTEITSALDAELTLIARLQKSYSALGLEYDGVRAKHESVIAALETMTATSEVTEDQLASFIETYRVYITLESPKSVPGLIEQLDEELVAIDRLKSAYSDLGLEYDEHESKQQAVLSVLSRLASSTDISSEQMGEFIAAYGIWIEKNAEASTGFDVIKQQFEEFSWDTFVENFEKSIEEDLIGSLNDFFSDLGKQIGSGSLDAEPLINSVIQKGTSMIAKAAGPYAPLVHLAGGILEGLTSAIFDTIEAAKEAETALAEAQEQVADLFGDVLDLEQELAAQRIEAIQDEMDLLEANRDLRLEILKDQWQRGEITGEDYFSQASGINAAYADGQNALDNQQTMITGVQDILGNLQEELDGLSGWTKFWTKADEKLSSQITEYQALLDAISADPDGLTDEEINQLAKDYHIEVPAAATGADFVTSGKQLLLVGDNSGGRERIQVTPVSSPNMHGPGTKEGLTININAPVYGVDDLYLQLEKAGRKLQRLGKVAG